MLKHTIIIFSLLLLFCGCAPKSYPHLPTVSTLSLEKYMGTWYEIARYENRFEEGCVGASAEYTMQEDFLHVINRCLNEKGEEISKAYGKAYAVENSENTKLKVSFFWPFYGNYWVLILAEDYRYVLIGEPSREYLWILSRTKSLTKDDLNNILIKLPSLGYDASKLYFTRY